MDIAALSGYCTEGLAAFRFDRLGPLSAKFAALLPDGILGARSPDLRSPTRRAVLLLHPPHRHRRLTYTSSV